MGVTPYGFIDDVARARDLIVSAAAGDHSFRLEPRESTLAWHCDLNDGTPTGDTEKAPFIRWVCPALRVKRNDGSTTAVPLDVHRPGPHSDLGRAAAWLRRRAGSSSGRMAQSEVDAGYAYTDPHGIIDDALRQRLEHWPPARRENGVVQPAELWSITITGEGLIVSSLSWWNNAAALDHQITLSIDIAQRLIAVR
jgi:hypothetical protein